MARKAKKRPLTKEHRAKLSAAATRRHAGRRGKAPRSEPARVAKKRLKNGRAPDGTHVLRRNGKGQDIIECDANEVLEALRVMRKIKQMICKA